MESAQRGLATRTVPCEFVGCYLDFYFSFFHKRKNSRQAAVSVAWFLDRSLRDTVLVPWDHSA